MACNIIYKNGKLEEVRADNGSPSILFQRAKQIFGEETAKEIFYVSKSDQFQEVFKATIEVYKQKLLNKFNNLTNEQADRAVSAVEEMQAIKDKAIADGTFMKAPNGQPTNLNEQQWLQVRTQEFKNWFGDWQNDPQNASKVVDSQGEPLVVWHGTQESFNEFSVKGMGVFTSESKDFADMFSGYYKNSTKPLFLNIRNPKIVSDLDFRADGVSKEEASLYLGVDVDFLRQPSFGETEDTNLWEYFDEDVRGVLESKGYDGVIGEEDGFLTPVSFNPNQIKSAEENIGTFSTETNDIRFSILGEKGAQNLDQIEEATFRMDNLLVAKEMEQAGKTPQEIRLATGWEKGASEYLNMKDEDIINTLLQKGLITETEC